MHKSLRQYILNKNKVYLIPWRNEDESRSHKPACSHMTSSPANIRQLKQTTALMHEHQHEQHEQQGL